MFGGDGGLFLSLVSPAIPYTVASKQANGPFLHHGSFNECVPSPPPPPPSPLILGRRTTNSE